MSDQWTDHPDVASDDAPAVLPDVETAPAGSPTDEVVAGDAADVGDVVEADAADAVEADVEDPTAADEVAADEVAADGTTDEAPEPAGPSDEDGDLLDAVDLVVYLQDWTGRDADDNEITATRRAGARILVS